MPQRSIRTLCLLLSAQLAACSATAHPPGVLWPQPRPAEPVPLVRQAPNFHAPSATHCARPVATRELPGRTPAMAPQETPYASPAARDRGLRAAPEALAKSEPAPSPAIVAAPAAGARSEAAADASRPAAPPAFAPTQTAPAAPSAQWQPPPAVVTAGVVDDNADFTSYLAFRQRTRVEHRVRDVRERYLLSVKDGRGRGIADAEVAVSAASGHATWARTDTAGQVWLHPDAFDPGRAGVYDIAVRKDGRVNATRLVRGQKSAVEVVLDAVPAPARAQLDLVFLIDATGSMADEIDKLKATLRTITAEVSQLPSRPDLCLGLVAYRDRGDAFLVRSHDFTNDVGGFLRDALYPLQAGGGGDYPEAMNEALHETVHRLSWRGDGATRLVVLLADAPPHLDYGAPHYDDDMMAALGKGIKIFGVGASGLDKQGEFIQRQIAQYTGGRFVFLTYAQAHRPGSGPGRETVHDVRNYSVDTLDRLIVRLVSEELGRLSL
jgi:Mg-chelatase subunit ChlD